MQDVAIKILTLSYPEVTFVVLPKTFVNKYDNFAYDKINIPKQLVGYGPSKKAKRKEYVGTDKYSSI